MPRKRLTKDIINERLKPRGIVMLDDYVLQSVKARFECRCGNVWAARPGNILSGKGCPQCGKRSALKKKRLSADAVKERLASRGIKLVGKYVNSQTKTQFQCDNGHVWETIPAGVMRGTCCPQCNGNNLPLSKEIVNSRIADRGISLIGDYMGAHRSTKFQCRMGHTWQARPNNVLQGRNCPHCAGQYPLSKDIVNERIADRGLVMLGEYVNNQITTTFQCSQGHTWEASPANVLAGTGCAICYGKNIPLTTKKVNERIADRGLILLDDYVNNHTSCRFQCSEGHIWETAPANVLSGRGCHTCADRTSDNDIFYLWLAGPQELVRLNEGEILLKYGVTSERRGDLRIKEIGWAWNTIPNVIVKIKTMGPANWAEKAAARIGRSLSPEYSDLDGWTEFRIVNKSELAEMLVMADEAAEYKIVWKNPTPHIEQTRHKQLRLDFV